MNIFDERLFFLETLKGKFDNIPKDCSRLVRIFLSSTFSGKKILYLKLELKFCLKILIPKEIT